VYLLQTRQQQAKLPVSPISIALSRVTQGPNQSASVTTAASPTPTGNISPRQTQQKIQLQRLNPNFLWPSIVVAFIEQP